MPAIILSPFRAGTNEADVYIPTGVPGIDHAGNLFRTDGVISLPLKKLRESDSYSAAAIIGQVLSHITGTAA